MGLDRTENSKPCRARPEDPNVSQPKFQQSYLARGCLLPNYPERFVTALSMRATSDPIKICPMHHDFDLALIRYAVELR